MSRNESEGDCINCYTKTLLNKKTYIWHVKPFTEYITKGLYDGSYWDTITIYLCDDCVNTLKKYNIRTTHGQDRWNAIDNLFLQIPDIPVIPNISISTKL